MLALILGVLAALIAAGILLGLVAVDPWSTVVLLLVALAVVSGGWPSRGSV